MSPLLQQFAAWGVRFDLLPGDRIRAHGELTDELRATIQVNKPAILAELAAADAAPIDTAAGEIRHFRWSIRYPNLEPMEVFFSPLRNAAEVLQLYPGAIVTAIGEGNGATRSGPYSATDTEP
jgi:hypothetical protein